MDTNSLIGQRREFSLIPYHGGTMEITEIKELRTFNTGQREIKMYEVRGRLVEGWTTSRLFGETSTTPMDPSVPVVVPCVADWELEAEDKPLRYTYGV